MATTKIQELTDASFEQEVLKSDLPVLVDFWAEWCGPCRQLAPIVDQLADELDGRLKVCKMDIQEHQSVATQFQVTAIPALLLFKGGELVEKIVGLQPKRNLLETIEPQL
jgi:thioredoxin 1